MTFSAFERQVFFATIRIKSTHGERGSIGTGFLFQMDLSVEGQEGIFLVTNKHVLIDRNGTVALTFHKRSTDNVSPLLGQSIDIFINDTTGIYYEHEDSEIDLACLNISHYINTNPVYCTTIHDDLTQQYDITKLHPGGLVNFIGYPDNRYDKVNNLPILRTGHIATIPEINFNGKKQFLIDAQVYPGSSGSPVFASIDRKYKLLGVVTETMITDQRLKSIPVDFKFGVQQPIGLGIVLKTELVLELLQHAASTLTERIITRLEAEGVPWKQRNK